MSGPALRARLVAWATGDPLDLAVFRVTVAVVVLGSVDTWEAGRWAAAAVGPPAGWGLVTALLPPGPLLAQVALALVVSCSGLTLVGLGTRWAAPVAALALVWLLGVPQHSGQVLHSHHLAWFLALVAAGPSGEALSVDAWRLRRRGLPAPGPSVAHGLPVRMAWLSIGLLFWFPGAWKLAALPGWLEALPGLVAWKRFQLGWDLVPVPADGWLRAGGAATIAFELLVGPLLLWRRTRLWAAAAALAFHLGVQALLGIGFSSLWACYAVCGDWSRWLGRPVRPAEPRWSAAAPALAVGGALVVAQLVTGAAGREDTWPVACYPTFRHAAPALVSWVEIEELVGEAAARPVLTLAELRRRGQRWWALSARAAARPSPEALARLHRAWTGAAPSSSVRFVLATWRPGASPAVERRVLPPLPAP